MVVRHNDTHMILQRQISILILLASTALFSAFSNASLNRPSITTFSTSDGRPCFRWTSPAPGIEYGLSVSDRPQNSTNKYDISWTKGTTSTSACWNSGFRQIDRRSGVGTPTGAAVPHALQAGRQYYWKVVAIDRRTPGKLSVAHSYESSFVVATSPVKPSLYTPVNRAQLSSNMCFSWQNAGLGVTYRLAISEQPANNNNQYNLFWGQPSDITGTRVCWDTSWIQKRRVNTSYATPTGASTPAMLASGKTYYWKVVALKRNNPAGMVGTHSEQRSFSLLIPPQKPALASPMNGELSSNTPCFSWSNLGAGITYGLAISESPANSNNQYDLFWGRPSDLHTNSTCWDDSWVQKRRQSTSHAAPTGVKPPATLESGKTYYWKVVALNRNNPEGHVGTHSEQRSFEVPYPPVKPILLGPFDGEATNGAPCFSIQGSKHGESYGIAVSDAPANSNNQYQQFWRKSVTVTDSPICWDTSWEQKRRVNKDYAELTGNATPAQLEQGKPYYWKVVAIDRSKPAGLQVTHSEQRTFVAMATRESIVTSVDAFNSALTEVYMDNPATQGCDLSDRVVIDSADKGAKDMAKVAWISLVTGKGVEIRTAGCTNSSKEGKSAAKVRFIRLHR